MGLLSNLMGHASSIDPRIIETEFAPLFFAGEAVEAAFQLYRERWIFTNKRLIMQTTHGLTGSKKNYHTVPYHAISQFAVETAGSFDLDCEIRIWVGSLAEPFKQELKKGTDVLALQQILAKHICR